MRLKRRRSSRPCDGFSLVEAAFAAALVAVAFVTLFALNTQCLYFVNSSREVTTAGQTVQSRMEQLRNCTWAQITDATSVQTLLTPPMTGASSLGSVTEVVTINKYPLTNPSPTPIQLTRVGSGVGNVVPTINSTNSTIASADMVAISLQLSWTAGPRARARKIAVSTIYGKNTQ